MTYVPLDIESSYKKNDIGRSLYESVIKHKPEIIIDFGVLNGYSTLALAQGLRDLGRGIVIGLDLFEKYAYNKSTILNTKQTIKNEAIRIGFNDYYRYIQLYNQHFYYWLSSPTYFDMLHLDISNTGTILKEVYATFKGSKSTILCEGGSQERDNVEWMLKYKAEPIIGSVPYTLINSSFPSLSKLDL